MAFTYLEKTPGELIRSADWNAVGMEVARLGGDKVDRAGNDAVNGSLAVRGDFTVGAANKGAPLRVFKKQEDGTAADHGAVILGTDGDASASLRLGYSGPYSWIQGQGKNTLALNPRGGNVGVGTDAPQERLEVAGALRVGSGANPLQIGGGGHTGFVNQAPANAEISNDTGQYKTLMILGNRSAGGPRRVSVWDRLEVNGALAVTGDVSLGASLYVGGAAAVGGAPTAGDVVLGAAAGKRFLLHTRSGQYNADFLQVTVDAADGAWQWGQGITLRRGGNVGIANTDPQDRLHVNGSARLLGDGNALRITGGWSNFGDGSGGKAEISNDTGTYKALMIVGNGSGGQGRRVGVWDRLEVNGSFATTGDASVGGAMGFGATTRQMLNLWNAAYGIGVQNATHYARSDAHFAWFRGGAHHNDTFNPGPNGAALMVLRTDGALGLGTTAPADRLHVNGAARVLGDTNPIRFTSTWSRFPDAVANQAEICNDTTDHKTLMIVGNQSAGQGRKVSVWDRLDVNGQLWVNGRFDAVNLFSASFACADFLIGHPDRRKTPGRAFVDGTRTLIVNFGADWPDGVEIHGGIRQEGWKTAPFQNGWTNYGGGYNDAGFFKDSNGIVHLKGLVKNGAMGWEATVFTLPPGYRPAARQLHIAISFDVGVRCDITPDGRIIPVSGNPGWFCLDPITFRAA